MSKYREFWKPEDFAQAEFSIDTHNSGEAFWAWGEAEAARLAAYCPEHPLCVVDFGCGVGRVLRNMVAVQRIGLDVSVEMLRLAREYALGCEFYLTDGAQVPLESGSADFIYSLLTLQHMDVPDVLLFMCDARRVLSARGRVFLSFSAFGERWNLKATLGRAGLVWHGTRQGAHHGAHGSVAYTPEAVATMAELAGLSVLSLATRRDDPVHPYIDLWAMREGAEGC